MEDYIKTVELHAQKKAETVVSREDLGLDISSGAAADYPSPVLPKRTLVVPVDGSPDSFAALELGLQMSLDPTPPGPFRLYIAALSYVWDRMPGSKEEKQLKADRFAEALKAKAIHQLQEFEKQAGKKVFYGTGQVSIVGDALDKEFTKAYDKWFEHHPDPSAHPRIVVGAQDVYAEVKHNQESDLVKRIFKHATPGTEIIVVDAQSSSIVRTSANLAGSIHPPARMPTREQVIPKALEAIAAAHAGAAKAPPPRSSSLAGNAQAAAAPSAVAAETAGLAKTNEEFAKLEKELEAGASSAGEQAAAAVTTAVGDAGKVANTAVAEAGKAVEAATASATDTVKATTEKVEEVAAAGVPQLEPIAKPKPVEEPVAAAVAATPAAAAPVPVPAPAPVAPVDAAKTAEELSSLEKELDSALGSATEAAK